MFRLRWLQVGGATRGMPRRDRAHRKPWPALGAGRLPCVASKRLSVRSIQQLRKRLVWPVRPVRLLQPRLELGFSTGSNGGLLFIRAL